MFINTVSEVFFNVDSTTAVISQKQAAVKNAGGSKGWNDSAYLALCTFSGGTPSVRSRLNSENLTWVPIFPYAIQNLTLLAIDIFYTVTKLAHLKCCTCGMSHRRTSSWISVSSNQARILCSQYVQYITLIYIYIYISINELT